MRAVGSARSELDSGRAARSRLLGPSGPEVSCEECFELLDEHADLELAGHEADRRLPGLHEHLQGCPACREDHESLRDLVRLEGAPGGLIPVRPIVRPGLNSETGAMREQTPDLDPATPMVAADLAPDPPSTRPSVDDMGEASFPASDPPAVWTWDPPPSWR